MLTLQKVNEILSKFSMCPFGVPLALRSGAKGDSFWIQVVGKIPCCNSGALSEQHGGKHLLSQYATENEVYFKVWKAYQDFLLHEAHESFYFENVRVFDPHISFVDLVEKSKRVKRITRDGDYTPPVIFENM